MGRVEKMLQTGLFAVVMLVCTTQIASAAVVAGKVVFARGTPQAIDPAGHSRTLSKGSQVYSGDKLVTGNGRLQVSFIDGAFMSVQPNSQFKIDKYRFSGKQDGTESAIYDLLKGGVRAVTGLIGHKHPDAFKVETSVATIGIRGTGFSSRICEGDCPGEKDGLYHYTWEGTTYVYNNVQSRDVPRGSGVYVQSINSPIVILAQPPAVTAVDTGTKQQKKQQQAQDTATVVASGDQRTTSGTQTAIASTSTSTGGGGSGGGGSSSGGGSGSGTSGGGGSGSGTSGGSTSSATLQVLTGMVAAHVNPDSQAPTTVDINGLKNVSAFLNSNSQLIGGLFTQTQTNCTSNCTHRQLATVDLNSMLLGNDAASVSEVNTLLAGGNQTLITQAKANPGQVAEYNTSGPIGWARWTGDVLTVSDNGQTDLLQQTGDQSTHVIYGPALTAPLPTTGQAYYNFIGGTQSTSLSGATIGQGVTSGTIVVPDFSTPQAALDMTVVHGITYTVAGLLTIGSNGGLHDNGGVIATTGTAASSACYPSCATYIEGGFSDSSSGGIPLYAGISYAIQETDPIIGVAAFSGGSVSSITYPVYSGLDGGHINVDNSNPSAVSSGGLSNLYVFTDATGNIIGIQANVNSNSCTGTGCTSTAGMATVDLNAMLQGNDPTAVAEVQSLVAGGNPTLIAQAQANPGHVAESFYNGSIGWARWTGGDVLTVDQTGSTNLNPQTGYQSIHVIFGQAQTAPLPTFGSATYTFIGGTQSTSLSGATIGQGVTSGTISISNFGSGQANLNMQVVHGNTYTVSGPLSFGSNGFNGVNVTASLAAPAAGSACYPSCSTFVNGGFVGPISATSGAPQYAGIIYSIQESDPIIGVAAFKGP